MIKFYDNGYGEFTTKRLIGPGCWDRFDLIGVHEGAVRFVFQHHEIVHMTAGQVVLIFPDTHFMGYPEDRCYISVEHFAIDADAEDGQLPRCFRQLRHRRGSYQFGDGSSSTLEADVKRCTDWGDQTPSEHTHDLRVAALVLIIDQLFATPKVDNITDARHLQFERMLAVINDRLNASCVVEEMAKEVGLSTSHFRAEFRRLYHCSPGRYLQNLRIRHACTLLTSSAMTTKEIAWRTGYGELPNFHRAFRRYLEMTPGEYRERYALKG